MKIPSRNRHWLKEVIKAYEAAEKTTSKSGGDTLEMYKLAPSFVAKNRSITSEAIVQDMLAEAEKDVAYEKKVDPDSENHYKFHFVSAYIRGHVVADLMSEFEADKIMDYINQEWQLFTD
ncbi:hypothetical protein [Marinimicrobium sp. ABcell2]|uniref:hypothetical protein n=1 Tax=Marinimicrobium sp. ABcell2 TaxID=3069751 RepID=UPI0027AFC601|nr:hypothetical protein [Marinimicrobium sp. ABcell2]MDQ2076754.1 hypothetical protein [Marinimicrobium sp. ABcell2]